MKQQLLKVVLPTTIVSLLMISCSNPLPADKLDYAGEWKSAEMYLLILKDGSLNYKKVAGGTTTTINGSIAKFNGNNFEGGVAFITSTFVVSKPPYLENGVWKMVVDGVELTKTQ